MEIIRIAAALAVAIACAVVANDMTRSAPAPAGASARITVVVLILLVAAAMSASLTSAFVVESRWGHTQQIGAVLVWGSPGEKAPTGRKTPCRSTSRFSGSPRKGFNTSRTRSNGRRRAETSQEARRDRQGDHLDPRRARHRNDYRGPRRRDRFGLHLERG